MARFEALVEKYGKHIATPWQHTIAGAQRVVIIVYDKELERTLRARKDDFQTETNRAGHDWHEIDLADAFSHWMAADDYRDEYFACPDDLQLKLEAEFPDFVADQIRKTLTDQTVTDGSVVAIFGVAALFGFARISQILKMVEGNVKGRLVVFFPGQFEQNNYRLLDARDGWNYLAVPITMHGEGANA